MQSILFFALIAAFAVITLALILGLSLGLGWLLTLFLPFSLFERTLLTMIAGLPSGVLWYLILTSFDPFQPEEIEDAEDAMEDEMIPESRFWKTSDDRTWENLFRYILANAIVEDIIESPGWVGDMDESQQQELAIRLAETALRVLKRTARQTKRLRMTRGLLRQQLKQEGQQPYEDRLLDLVVTAVNVELVYLEEDLKKVAQGRKWHEHADVLMF